MSDIVKQLRDFAEMPLEGGPCDALIDVFTGMAKEAADEIERLRLQIGEKHEAE